MSNDRPFNILLVEDDPADAFLARTAIRESKLLCEVHHMNDGDKALSFLRHQGDYAAVPRPDLVLLDLNMPGRDGRQVLSEIKADQALRDIPVVILTTSDASSDIKTCYAAGANSFVTKPVDLDGFLRAMRSIEDYWFEVVRLPH
ncbi:MAG TPA: response regulator [Candidatus Sulfotelmatobacter sp.]|jgi:CheY-like chemotaxis protein|nr:response regulator [Candidatus Sulfotelmatobacter sp.]